MQTLSLSDGACQVLTWAAAAQHEEETHRLQKVK
jgi:hypothetical protein